jgi:hypothetical protein
VGLLPASVGASGTSPGAGQAVSVAISRPFGRDAAAPSSAQSDGDDRLTVEVRREPDPNDPARPADRVVVTVSLNGVTQQIAVAL